MLEVLSRSQGQESQRLKLQREREQDLKKFLQEQSANTHPRLARLMKKNALPAGPITSTFPRIVESSQNAPMLSGLSQPQSSEQPRPPLSIETQAPRQEHHMQRDGREPFFGLTHPMPNAVPYGYMPIQPNPYLPPLNGYSGYAVSPHFGDPFLNHYAQNPYHQMPSYPRPPTVSTHQQFPQSSPYPQQLHSPVLHQARDQNHSHSMSPLQNQGRRHSINRQSKDEYAKELERQISEAQERKKRDKKTRMQPDGGFLGGGGADRNLRSDHGRYDENSNDGYESGNSVVRRHKSNYQKELDDQIRIKQEMKMKERVRQEKELAMYSPNFNNSNSSLPELVNASRKQFPEHLKEIYGSAVFPMVSQKSPIQQLNRYTALPAIQSNFGQDFGREFPSYPASQSMFPPTDEVTAANFSRGNIPMNQMTDWQRNELVEKENLKKKNQKEIQDVLKQQIAAKEMERQRQLREQKEEDERERVRIEKEQEVLRERYKREREELLAKEEEERQEKERAIAEKKARMKIEEQITPVPIKPKKVIRMPSPELPPENLNVQPFRSDSPPLPAQLKLMKENGYIEPSKSKEPPVPSPKPKKLNPEPPIQTRDHKRETSPALQSHQRSPSPKTQVRNDSFDNSDNNNELLDQLRKIQLELQNEDLKVIQEIEEDEANIESGRTGRLRFENEVDQIDRDLRERPETKGYSRSHTPAVAEHRRYTPTAPAEPRRQNLSGYRNYRNVASARSIHTPLPPPRKLPTRALDSDSQIMKISKTISSITGSTFAPPPENVDDLFNIDEIERRNETRLRNLHEKDTIRSNSEIIQDFLINGTSSKYQDRSIPTSPSTFQPIPFDLL